MAYVKQNFLAGWPISEFSSLNPAAALPDPGPLHLARKQDLLDLQLPDPDMSVYHAGVHNETLATLKHYARLTILDLKKTREKCHPGEREAQI